MVDMVVHRRDMRATLSRLCGLLTDRRQDTAPIALPLQPALVPAKPAAA